MHWGDEYLGGHMGTGAGAAGVNSLTTPSYCPQSKQPELKHAAVKIEKAELPWRLLAIAWLDETDAFHARAALQALMGEFAFATCVPFGRERHGVLFRAADAVPVPMSLLEQIESLLGMGGTQVLRYLDNRRGQRRCVRLSGAGETSRIEGLLLGGDSSAEAWMKCILQEQQPAQSYGRLLLLPGAKPPVAVVGRGQQVCSCFDVAAPQIAAALATFAGPADEQLARLQNELKCGTNCGSCIPELRRLVRLAAHP
jgi:assimilatory nitrate reductase catalytic subunit